jgi:methylated-DNA-[protein]-cysteine S-methyltransferase
MTSTASTASTSARARPRLAAGPVLATMPSPVGVLRLVATDDGLAGIYFPDHRHAPVLPQGTSTPTASAPCPASLPTATPSTPARARPDHPVLVAAIAQLAAYFAGERDAFTVPLAPRGTPFQHRVWAALARIPFGETRTYADIARAIGAPAAVRAVGAANGRNPLSIIVPCHRVIGTGGKLTGYAGGVDAKRWLLAHEGVRGTR